MPNEMPRKADGTADRSAPRPYRKNGQTLHCTQCGTAFYRRASMVARGITKTCGNRECISKSMQNAGNPYWGKNHSPEVLAKLKARRTAKPPGAERSGPPPGWCHSAETRAQMSTRMRERWATHRDVMLANLPRGAEHHRKKTNSEPRYRANFTPWQRENWKADKCAWCCATAALVLDHIVAVADDGTSIRENAQTLCQPCNLWKAVHVDRPYHLARLALQRGYSV